MKMSIKGFFGSTREDDNKKNEYLKLRYPSNSTPTTFNFGSVDRKTLSNFLTGGDNGEGANSVVYSIVSRIASTTAELFNYVEVLDGKNKVIESHAILDKLKQPNDLDSRTTFIETVIYNLLSVGDAFVYGEWNAVSKTRTSLYSMPSASIDIINGTLVQPIKGYKLKGSVFQSNPTLTPDNTLFIRLPNIGNKTMYGLSPLQPLLKDLKILDRAKRLQQKLLDEGGVRNLICLSEFPEGQNADAFLDTLEKQINKSDGKTNQVYSVPLNRIPMGDTAVDLRLQEIITDCTRTICNAYSFPFDLLNGNSTFSNQKQAKEQLYIISIPFVSLLCEALESFFKLSDDNLHLSLNTDQIEELKPDYTAVVNAMRGVLTINEIRQYMKYPPIDGGDVLLVSLGQMPISDLISGAGTDETEPKK